MTKISPKQGKEVIRIFGKDINAMISVFIKSDNCERLSQHAPFCFPTYTIPVVKEAPRSPKRNFAQPC